MTDEVTATPRVDFSVSIEGAILGMGNPLLDISANVGEDMLTKYGLEANNAILAEDKHLSLYTELKENFKPEYTAGGATQNSIRTAQWILQTPGATSYFGAVGKDDFCEKMTANAKHDGVNVQYFQNTDIPTGTCGVLITQNGHARSLVANLAAANTYPVEHLKDLAQWSVVEKARVYYIAGFFLTVSPPSVLEIGKHAYRTGKTFCMNLSAPFLLEVPVFLDAFKSAKPWVDTYFGNETEAKTLSKAMGWETENVREIAIKLSREPKASARPRTVIFTQGAESTIVVVGDPERLWSVDEYGVIPCPKNELLDSNGAGDAFVGGYIAGLARGVTQVECVAMGNYCANVVIKRSGATLPDKPYFCFQNAKLTV
eukprot:Plantae.Rhodophyta-Purpureofilum_apyrenoidigerum.ctg14290.p1 GENE.Plantae.Rhodophyta-Purpureofilum_apyrenoidigerum.ctg14290~~Plantae.Rhodophyta-Purpureofilum_apyrenoidigerum.ctg14290.p1  ORF type:complete len:372 (+),score=69.33 Plantae.Rhodophyta-Purpureofilum_apyrenoidigerum.ctg14290:83-1198(+)